MTNPACFFSANVGVEMSSNICSSLGINMAESPGKYLGLPVLWGRSKVEALGFVRDRVSSKVQGWKQELLSQAGREVLIKAVANAIPTYPMMCFLFPKKSCKDLDRIISNFWWGQKEHEGQIHWKSWKHLSNPKSRGGLGFKDFQSFNLALLAQTGWRILQHSDALWVRILKSFYFPHSSFLNAQKGPRASWAWSSILSGRDVLEKGLSWAVGDGCNIRFWKDPWIPNFPGFKISLSIPIEAMEDNMVGEFMFNRS